MDFFCYCIYSGQVHKKFCEAIESEWVTLNCPQVWRPRVYMLTCLMLSRDIQGGMFYWYTYSSSELAFSEVVPPATEVLQILGLHRLMDGTFHFPQGFIGLIYRRFAARP